MSINKVLLLGNVGKDPVVRYFDKGVALATFPLATSETYTNQQGETITSTEWHNIVLWRALAEVAEKTVKKGTQLYVTGKIKTRSYVDRDGNNKYITEILADTMIVMEKKPAPNNYSGQPDSTNDDSQAGKNDSQEANEPNTGYATSSNNKNGGASMNDQPDQDETFRTGPDNSQNEDDLPF